MTLHATCVDGPLEGASFTIESCPRLVRCVRAGDGTPDILNLPEDAPRLDESVHWYQWDGTAAGFICGRKAFSATMIRLHLAPAGLRPLQAPGPLNPGARAMPLTCGCAPKYLTSVSVPVTAEDAVAQPCPCCNAPAGKRCDGGTAGWLDDAHTRAWVDVCPGRLEVQRSLL